MIAKRVVIFGGTGFVGRYVVKELVDEGYDIRLISGDEKKAAEVMTYGDIGQIEYVKGSICDYHKLDSYISDCGVVINMVGILHERYQKFHVLHAGAVENLAKVIADKKDVKFVHISALGVEKVFESKYARSKANGEKAVRSTIPDAIILKPSIMFGKGAKFFDTLCNIIDKMFFIPVIQENTKVQPLYVGDFVKAILEILKSDQYNGKTLDIVGSETYTIGNVFNIYAKSMNSKKYKVSMPKFISYIIGAICEWKIFSFLLKPILGNMDPIITRDFVLMLGDDNLSENNFLDEIGIETVKLEDKVEEQISMYL